MLRVLTMVYCTWMNNVFGLYIKSNISKKNYVSETRPEGGKDPVSEMACFEKH
jgi:hypothetical protein